MNQTDLSTALAKLKALGLNIVAARKISHLDQIIVDQLNQQKIKTGPEDTLLMIAHGGIELWNHLPHPLDKSAHPIDAFSKKTANEFLSSLGVRNFEILFPNNEYLLPLQRLGRELNIGRQTPMGIDINETFGTWFGYRAVALIKDSFHEIEIASFDEACRHCADQACLKKHPLDSRLYCHYEKEHQYTKEQINYHKRRFFL